MAMQFLRALLLLCSLLIFGSDAFAQQWTLNGDDAFMGMARVDDSSFVMVTSRGEVIRTRDGWKTWSHSKIEGEYNLRSVAFAGSRGMIVGDRCYYYSTDAGESWTRERYPSWEVFNYLVALRDGSFRYLDSKGRIYTAAEGAKPTILNDSRVWTSLNTTLDGSLIAQGVDGSTIKMFESTDGGSSWSLFQGEVPEKTIYQYAFTDRSHVVLLIATSPKNYALYSTNGGSLWDTIITDGPVWRLDSTTLRIGDLIYSTVQGLLDSVPYKPFVSNSIEIKAGDRFYKYDQDELMISQDLTRSWQTRVLISYPKTDQLRAYGTGKLKSNYSTIEDQIYHSTDSGLTWRPEGKADWEPFQNISDHQWISDSLGYLNLYDSVLYTTDAGNTYTAILRRAEPGGGFIYLRRTSIEPSDSVIVIFGEKKLYTIAGDHVTEGALPVRTLNNVDVRGSNIAVTGFDDESKPLLAVSRNAGKDWVTSAVSEAGQVAMVDQEVIFKRGSAGWQRTTDDGKTWTPITHPGTYGDYYFHSRDSMIVANDSVRVSTDGGKTWRSKLTYPYYSINGVISVAYGQVYFSNRYLAAISLHDLFGGQPVIPSVAKIRWIFGSGDDQSVVQAPNGDLVKWSATAAYKIMRSSDLGKTWVRSDSGAPSTASRLYAAGNELYTSTGYRSSTQGRSWKRMGITPTATIFSLAYAKNGYLYYSDNTLFFSRDKGLTWNQKDTILRNEMTRGILAHPITGDLYVATELGVLRSLDNGISWDTIRSRRQTGAWPTLLSITPTGKIYYATENNIEASTDDGTSWYQLPPAGSPIALVAVHDSLLCGLFGSNEYYFRYTTDDGQHWIDCDTFKSGPNRLENLRDLRLLKSGHLVVAGETHGISRTVFPMGEGQSVVITPIDPEVSNDPCVTISPNPATSTVALGGDCVSPGVATIYNSAGAVCLQLRWANNDPIDVRSLSPGVYYLQLADQISRFVITR